MTKKVAQATKENQFYDYVLNILKEFKQNGISVDDLLECKVNNLLVNNLVLHGLPNVPHKKKGTAFSKYVAFHINRLLPRLPDKVSYRDIHASHPLGKAVLVRFQRRDLKNEIYKPK